MVNRRGSTEMGCLSWLLIVAIIVYVGINVGAPYMRYYRFRDAVDQQVRYATFRNDDAMREEIWAAADSLGLPEEAYHVTVERAPSAIRVFGSYDDAWKLFRYSRPVHFILNETGPL
ncbi:MAG TPA: hypothetical protein VIC03_11440 [Gemmatimonadaceae bacterium]|jgi:hypothetical protein